MDRINCGSTDADMDARAVLARLQSQLGEIQSRLDMIEKRQQLAADALTDVLENTDRLAADLQTLVHG